MQGRLWITGALGALPIFNGGMAHTIENGQASSLKLGEMRTAGDLKEPLPRSHLGGFLATSYRLLASGYFRVYNAGS